MGKKKEKDNAETVTDNAEARGESVLTTVMKGTLHKFEIAKGKTVTSLKGILTEGHPCEPGDFAGGQKTFVDLGEKGYIVEAPAEPESDEETVQE